jgi:hypothetical protein
MTTMKQRLREGAEPLAGYMDLRTSDQTKALLKRGYRILAHGFDVLMLKQYVRQAADWRRV